MKFRKKEASAVENALREWKSLGSIDAALYENLMNDIEIIAFDWKRLAKYSFWISLICVITSLGAVLADKALLRLIQLVFDVPHVVKMIACILVATALYWYGFKRRLRLPDKIFSNEAILFLGVIATAGAIYQLGRMVGTVSGHFSLLLFLSFIVYAILGFYFKSKLIWLFSLLSLGSWLGSETGYASGWGAYYLGMNYPLRFVLLGGGLITAAFCFEKSKKFVHLYKTTLVVGLLHLFIALWIMSIFGNYGDMDSWYRAKQMELFHWSLLFGLVSVLSIFHGLRFDNGTTKRFGITFLFINLYTRYFEYFWDGTHKAIFFLVLGISFWFLGSKAEEIWSFGNVRQQDKRKNNR